MTLDVEDEGRIVGSQEVRLPTDGEPAAVRVRFTASEAGPAGLPLQGRAAARRAGHAEQPARGARSTSATAREKILYFEGEPRFELKFIRRAVQDDKNLQARDAAADGRQQVPPPRLDNPDHLLGGFPKTREELFAYRGLILGSIEAGAFTGDQLRMIADFVERRGGGLLMLGGAARVRGGRLRRNAGRRRAAGRPRASDQTLDAGAVARLKVRPTRDGVGARGDADRGHRTGLGGIVEQAADAHQHQRRLQALKPGATALLTGADERRREQVVLAYQRYGRGKAIAFPGAGLVALADARRHPGRGHDARELLAPADALAGRRRARSRSKRTPSPTASRPASTVTSPRTWSIHTFVEINDALVVAHVDGPEGDIIDVPMQWTGERNGQYRGTFVAPGEGLYTARVEATRGEKSLGTGVNAAPRRARRRRILRRRR